ncbi:hypothetical protein P7K49_027807 [Saguinus oedipus]|uniref:Uncharacterized protein n=1 Tax=Saguinus oedipus TaxID=9490 RepID=A0ABQ9UAG8_SAGOE|nr:hypothetical protein P7K49_027807 [Saguinus oedipus]
MVTAGRQPTNKLYGELKGKLKDGPDETLPWTVRDSSRALDSRGHLHSPGTGPATEQVPHASKLRTTQLGGPANVLPRGKRALRQMSEQLTAAL